MFHFFYTTALATAYGQRPKFVRAKRLAMAKHSAMVKGENYAYGPSLESGEAASFIEESD